MDVPPLVEKDPDLPGPDRLVVVGPQVDEDVPGHRRRYPRAVDVVQHVPGAQVGQAQVFWGTSGWRPHVR